LSGRVVHPPAEKAQKPQKKRVGRRLGPPAPSTPPQRHGKNPAWGGACFLAQRRDRPKPRRIQKKKKRAPCWKGKKDPLWVCWGVKGLNHLPTENTNGPPKVSSTPPKQKKGQVPALRILLLKNLEDKRRRKGPPRGQKKRGGGSDLAPANHRLKKTQKAPGRWEKEKVPLFNPKKRGKVFSINYEDGKENAEGDWGKKRKKGRPPSRRKTPPSQNLRKTFPPPPPRKNPRC